MCGRRICDITATSGGIALLRAPKRVGIPEQKPSGRRSARTTGALLGQRPRDPAVRIFVEESGDRFRIVHEHKRNGRGPLDRTVTAATLERLLRTAVEAGTPEVVLT